MMILERSCALVLVLLPALACDAPTAQTCDPASAGLPPRVTAERGSWPNQPAGFRTVSDVTPGGTRWGESGWRCEGDGLSLVADSTAPGSSRALVFRYSRGFASGYAPGVAYFNLATPAPETYFGFWWKPSDPWESHESGVNKIALLFPTTSAAGTVYVMMFFDGSRYTIQVETTFASDTRRLEPNLTATPVALGTWHQIEWYVRYSSSPTSRDGVVRWWLDGVPQGMYTDLQMPPDPGFIEYTIRPVWGGGLGAAKGQTDSYSYGPLHISTP